LDRTNDVRKLLAFLFLAVIVTVSTIVAKLYLLQADISNLILNPGFETAGGGGADVWTQWAEQDGPTDEGINVHGGAHAAEMQKTEGGGTDPRVSQYATVIPGHRYRLTFWGRGDGATGASLRLGVYDGTNALWITTEAYGDGARIPTGQTSATFTEFRYGFVAPAGCVSVAVEFGVWGEVGVSTVYVDDVTLLDLDGVTWTDLSADVLSGLTWGRGMAGGQILDLVAGPGVLNFVLDNSASSVTGRLAGKYSPAHANALFGFGLGSPVKVTLNVNGGGEVIDFIGRVTAIRPSSGPYRDERVQVEAQDWMTYLAGQELGLTTIAASQRIDQAITTVLPAFPIQPQATAFGTGVETFLALFDGETIQTSMAEFFSKLARNEFGRIFLKGDGTLVVENRRVRPLNLTSSFTLNGTMSDLEIAYDVQDVANIIQLMVFPTRIDTVAVRLWDLSGAPAIAPGETLTMVCPYSDPLGGGPISATSVVNPVTVVEFGSVGDYVRNDLAAFLTQANEVGANALIAHLTNTSNKTGYLNDFQVYGLGIYRYSPIELETRDDFDIAANGERRASYRLELISDPNAGHNFADFILDKTGRQHVQMRIVRFNANQDAAHAAAAGAAEISQRFTLTEAATGLSEDFFINALGFSYRDNQLEVTIAAIPAKAYTCWIWDSSTWDNTDGEGWTL
jgi:hypothetical protein